MTQSAVPLSGKKKFLFYAAFCLAGIGLNVLCKKLAALAGIPLYLDSAGTVLAAVLGGYSPTWSWAFRIPWPPSTACSTS